MIDPQIYSLHSPSGNGSRPQRRFEMAIVSVCKFGKKIFFRVLIVIVLALTVSVIAMTNMLAKQGSQTQDIEKVISKLELENKDLRLAIASASSLSTIQEKSKRLGLSDRGFAVVDLLKTSLALNLQQ